MNKVQLKIISYLAECNNGYAGRPVIVSNLMREGYSSTEIYAAISSLLAYKHIVEIGVSQTYGILYCIVDDYEKIKEMFIEMGQKLA
jgi:hypothetical protein